MQFDFLNTLGDFFTWMQTDIPVPAMDEVNPNKDKFDPLGNIKLFKAEDLIGLIILVGLHMSFIFLFYSFVIRFHRIKSYISII
jgi:hypothetical protein